MCSDTKMNHNPQLSSVYIVETSSAADIVWSLVAQTASGRAETSDGGWDRHWLRFDGCIIGANEALDSTPDQQGSTGDNKDDAFMRTMPV